MFSAVERLKMESWPLSFLCLSVSRGTSNYCSHCIRQKICSVCRQGKHIYLRISLGNEFFAPRVVCLLHVEPSLRLPLCRDMALFASGLPVQTVCTAGPFLQEHLEILILCLQPHTGWTKLLVIGFWSSGGRLFP